MEGRKKKHAAARKSVTFFHQSTLCTSISNSSNFISTTDPSWCYDIVVGKQETWCWLRSIWGKLRTIWWSHEVWRFKSKLLQRNLCEREKNQPPFSRRLFPFASAPFVWLVKKSTGARHMFHPEGPPSVLNCHACISCCTKGAYVKNEQRILRAYKGDIERKRMIL